MKSNMRIAAALAVALLISACAGSSNMVVSPNRTNYKADQVNLVYEGATVGADDKGVAELKKHMEEQFFEKGLFQRGSKLTVKYGFMTYDPGSQAARYFLGALGGGEAKMVVGAEFFDENGTLVAKIQSEGRLGGGFFGGDSDKAIKKAAEEVAQFASANFR